jgi:hypothetical protein
MLAIDFRVASVYTRPVVGLVERRDTQHIRMVNNDGHRHVQPILPHFRWNAES